MSVLIPKMKMPESCAECGVRTEANCFVNYKWLLAHPAYYEKRREECPLIEIPPHGRLIDADELLQEHERIVDAWGSVHIVSVQAIRNAPTIIPAKEAR